MNCTGHTKASQLAAMSNVCHAERKQRMLNRRRRDAITTLRLTQMCAQNATLAPFQARPKCVTSRVSLIDAVVGGA